MYTTPRAVSPLNIQIGVLLLGLLQASIVSKIVGPNKSRYPTLEYAFCSKLNAIKRSLLLPDPAYAIISTLDVTSWPVEDTNEFNFSLKIILFAENL